MRNQLLEVAAVKIASCSMAPLRKNVDLFPEIKWLISYKWLRLLSIVRINLRNIQKNKLRALQTLNLKSS